MCHNNEKDSMAQWIRRWSTEPEILGSIPSGVEFNFCSNVHTSEHICIIHKLFFLLQMNYLHLLFYLFFLVYFNILSFNKFILILYLFKKIQNNLFINLKLTIINYRWLKAVIKWNIRKKQPFIKASSFTNHNFLFFI